MKDGNYDAREDQFEKVRQVEHHQNLVTIFLCTINSTNSDFALLVAFFSAKRF
ncbi:hypothetical protein SLEP1_g5931 [Rubroshorea leprosula]|uniref:Uncharacterized protein n=1 Tax=Rubroshorea leprosula TaxID=152421 RepID=A0AAV5I3D9_9ROSI|nr:hypothetical protein SLEP1_g5931 [Rubroshorea leprosula]